MMEKFYRLNGLGLRKTWVTFVAWTENGKRTYSFGIADRWVLESR